MSTDTKSNKKISTTELQALITNATKKVGCSKENDLCRYLPMDIGGYMHHFTWRKMKNEEPEVLAAMIEEFVINPSNPKKVPPKPRAARGSRKRRDQISLTRGDLEHMLKIARLAGEEELIRKLTPKRDLKAIKQELIRAIRNNKTDQHTADLWTSYFEVAAAFTTTNNGQFATMQGLTATATISPTSTTTD